MFLYPLDDKVKSVKLEKLKRTKNIRANSNVALFIDEYNEEWIKLFL
jgi:hypothetical protein